MTDLEKLKKITGEKDEELLQLLLEDAEAFVLSYTNRTHIVTTTYNEVDDNGAIVKRNVKAPTFYAVGDMLDHVKAIEEQTKERI